MWRLNCKKFFSKHIEDLGKDTDEISFPFSVSKFLRHNDWLLDLHKHIESILPDETSKKTDAISSKDESLCRAILFVWHACMLTAFVITAYEECIELD